MSIQIAKRKTKSARPIWRVPAPAAGDALPQAARRWAEASGFKGQPGDVLLVPATDGSVAGAVLALDDPADPSSALAAGALATQLPGGDWYFEDGPGDPGMTLTGLLMGDYAFAAYRKAGSSTKLGIVAPSGADVSGAQRVASAVALVRDLINTPANDMSPSALEKAVSVLAKAHKAKVKVTVNTEAVKGVISVYGKPFSLG